MKPETENKDINHLAIKIASESEGKVMRERDNVGVLDTAIRAIIACVLIALAAEQMFSPVATIAMLVVGSALFFTCATGVCLIYKVLGIDTYHLKY